MVVSPYLKDLSEEFGLDSKELEEEWKKAILIAEKTLGKSKADFTSDDYSYVCDLLREKILSDEDIIFKFLESDKSSREFLDELISSEVSPPIDRNLPLIVKGDKEDNDNEEEDKEEEEEKSDLIDSEEDKEISE